MSQRIVLTAASALVVSASFADFALAQQRSEPIRQGPESVFDQPVGELFAELATATPTGDDARIGYEFVYWSYELADGRNVFLYACAKVESVDCEQRRAAVCPGGVTIIARSEVVGRVRHLQCSNVGVAAPGALRPGCTDLVNDNSLDVGIAHCG